MENMFLCNALLYSIVSFSTYISSTQNIFRFIVDHKDSDYAVFQHQIESTDLTNKLQITNALIKDIIQKYEKVLFDSPLIITDKKVPQPILRPTVILIITSPS